MLRIQPIRSSLEISTLLESFSPENSTWVVSDLKSKLDLNRRLLRERGFVPGSAVLRASELWKALLTRTRADLQIVSREFVLTFIADQLARTPDDENEAWVRSPGVPQTVFDYMTQLMPVLSHPSGDEIMDDWFSRNEASLARWGRWFRLADRVWKMMLEEGFLAAPWVSGVLVNEALVADVWSRPLIVDLGADLTQVEADLLLVLGDHLDILVLKPEPTWRSEYARTLQAYEVLEAKVGVGHEKPLAAKKPALAQGKTEFRKYTTMIAEVKDATAQVRKWLEAGAKPTDIAVAAPDIEPYWFALQNYLDVEGVPCQKDRVRRLHSFPDVAQWLANLRLRTGGYSETDLELSMFGGDDGRVIGFDEFKTIYASLYGREDLARRKSVKAKFETELEPANRAPRDEFLTWSLKQLPKSVDLERIETGLKRVLAECPESLALPVHRWLAYLEQVLSRVEIRTAVGDPEGIAAIRLSSAENSPATHMMILGLTEAGLKKSLSTSILASDLWSLAQEFGFHLASEDQAQLEFETRWLIEAGHRDLVLAVAETDFDGSAQAPSWLWVKGSRESGQAASITLPSPTRWDEIQKGEFAQLAAERKWSESETSKIETAMRQDFNEETIADFAQGFVESLSPSKIEAYLECPFIFAAKHMFKLADDSELDLEVDPLRRGSLMHAVFEALTEEPVRFSYSDDELGLIIDKAREESRLELADERLWKPLRKKHIDLAKRFLDFEKQYRTDFSDARTMARELVVNGFLSPSTGELTKTPSAGALEFKGRIDRVDTDAAGRLAIYDYKSSGGALTQFGRWVETNKVQLLLYSLAIEKGLTDLKARDVFAALYYVARPFSRDTGFMIETDDQGLYSINKRKKNRLKAEEKDAFFREGQALIQKAVEGIQQGRFSPNPRDPKTCLDCRWSSLCRTPHLTS